MTPVQAKLLAYIDAYTQAEGFSPSYDEMARYLGLASKSGVHKIVHALRDRGKISHSYGRSRSIEVMAPRITAPRNALDRAMQVLCDTHAFVDEGETMIVGTEAEIRETLAAIFGAS